MHDNMHMTKSNIILIILFFACTIALGWLVGDMVVHMKPDLRGIVFHADGSIAYCTDGGERVKCN